MLDRSASSSTSRRPSEITDWLLRHPPQRQPDRDRGLWRFLTWPFFLAQVMIAGPFLGSGAQAALEENDAGLKQTPHNSGATADDLPSIGARSVVADDASETGSDVKVASHPALRLHHLQQFEGHSTALTLTAFPSSTRQSVVLVAVVMVMTAEVTAAEVDVTTHPRSMKHQLPLMGLPIRLW